MKSVEARDLGRTAGTVLRQLTELTRGAHLAVSDTAHAAVARGVGPSATPIRLMHNAIAAGVYATVGLALDGGSRVAGHIGAHRLRDDEHRPSVHDGPRARHAVALGLGLRGDTVAADAASLALDMHVRHDGLQVPLTPEGIAQTLPRVTPDVVVFLHGLFETERSWNLGAATRAPYADRLADELDLTPVMVRYNTGLRISDNARALSGLLDELVRAWPVPVERIVLVGHSMGGLVIHGALAVAVDAAESGSPVEWIERVTDTVALGSPHHGSAIARGVAGAAESLGRRTQGRWLADFLGYRSAGLRDLMHGNIVAADWEGHDVDDRLDRRTHPLPAPGISHYAVVGLLTAGLLPERTADWLGDLVVDGGSASHRLDDAERCRFGVDRVAVVTGVGHFDLLNHSGVYGHLRRWLTPDPVRH